MSWVFLLSIALLLAAIVVIEFRALREGDERLHHAPGYAFVMGGLVFLGFGVAAAAIDQSAIALLCSSGGLIAVLLGASHHHEAATH